MTEGDVREEISKILQGLAVWRPVPGSTYILPDLTPAQRRLIAHRLRQAAARIDMDER